MCAPHYRSAPDGNPYNNWSYPGNTNPVTGNVASGNPDTYLKNYYNRRSNPTYYSYSPSSILPYLLGSTTLNVTPTKKTSQEERSLRRLFIDSSVIELQSFLKLNSFDPGPTDGIYGPRTRRAYNLYIESLTPQIVSTSGYSSENQSIRDKIEDILQLKKPIALPQKSKPDIAQQATEDFKRGYDLESSIQKVLKKGTPKETIRQVLGEPIKVRKTGPHPYHSDQVVWEYWYYSEYKHDDVNKVIVFKGDTVARWEGF